MRDTISRVNDGTSQRALSHLRRGPGGAQGKHGLHGDVEPRHVEGLEEDLGGKLSVLRRVQWRLSQAEVVVLRLGAQVLENGVLPDLLVSEACTRRLIAILPAPFGSSCRPALCAQDS